MSHSAPAHTVATEPFGLLDCADDEPYTGPTPLILLTLAEYLELELHALCYAVGEHIKERNCRSATTWTERDYARAREMEEKALRAKTRIETNCARVRRCHTYFGFERINDCLARINSVLVEMRLPSVVVRACTHHSGCQDPKINAL